MVRSKRGRCNERGFEVFHDQIRAYGYEFYRIHFLHGHEIRVDDGRLDSEVQNVVFDGGNVTVRWRPVRPLPEGGGFFENVWRRYREDGNVY